MSRLDDNLALLPTLPDDHLSDWYTILAEQVKDPDALELRGTDVTMEDALASQAWAKTFIGKLEAEIIRRWARNVELSKTSTTL